MLEVTTIYKDFKFIDTSLFKVGRMQLKIQCETYLRI